MPRFLTVLPFLFCPAHADSCTSLVKSMCPGAAIEATPETTGRRVLKVEFNPRLLLWASTFRSKYIRF
jgi:hypothetical protein